MMRNKNNISSLTDNYFQKSLLLTRFLGIGGDSDNEVNDQNVYIFLVTDPIELMAEERQ